MEANRIQREALAIAAAGEFLPSLSREKDGWHARWIPAYGEPNVWVDRIVRRANVTPLTAQAENDFHPTLHDAFLAALRSRTGLVAWKDESEIRKLSEDIELWSRPAKVDPRLFSQRTFSFSSPEGGFGEGVVRTPLEPWNPYVLGRAIEIFPPLRTLEPERGGMLCAVLDKPETAAFLRSGAHLLAAAGFAVEGADVEGEIEFGAELSGGGEEKSGGGFGVKLEVRVAGKRVDAREIKFLLDQKSPFVFFRGRWIEVDRSVLKNALKVLERKMVASPVEAVRFAQGLGSVCGIPVAKLKAGGWLRGHVSRLRERPDAEDFPALAAKGGFSGTLRAYQSRGAAWMAFLAQNGFGALLADDMGLGKTVETIALLCALGKASRPCLVVAPLSLLANWRREIASFAPSFKVYVHHGENRAEECGFAQEVRKADVVLTSYALLVKDYAAMRSVAWATVVVDEAQWIKNADTRAAKALKALGAPRRIALTGTPVENSAMDVWSIEDFLNPGFLPPRKEFVASFAKPIAADARSAAAKKLRRALEPFMLRRLKSEKSIAAELGRKREIREYCRLSRRDRAKYESHLELWRTLEHRRGDVFALITALKLACDGEGKYSLLVDLVRSIAASGESALVFTQYAKVGTDLAKKLSGDTSARVCFLHGGLSAAEREREIERFNEEGPAVFVLSLKAGGFGLNLTKATHVIHYDRWWNPAVEGQATDRAHRIGQKKTVFVHLVISEGTIEERIDRLQEKKLEVSANLVGEGEAFLREMIRCESRDME